MVSMLISWPLWFSVDGYPSAPLFPFAAQVSPLFIPLISLLSMSVLVLSIVRWQREQFQTLLLATGLCSFGLLFILDQNRLQAWVYQALFFILLKLITSNQKDLHAAYALSLSAIYFWSGLHKFNRTFDELAAPWLAQPFHDWPSTLRAIAELGVWSSPALESLLAIGLLTERVKKFAALGLIATHIIILYVLGPLGLNYNVSVWPWNISQMALLICCFLNRDYPAPSLTHIMVLSRSVQCALVLYCCMPVLNRFGYWDNYPSFTLYSGDTPRAYVTLSAQELTHLHPTLQSVAKPIVSANAMMQFSIHDWSMAARHSPPYPERRVLLSACAKLCDQLGDSQTMTCRFFARPPINERQSRAEVLNCATIMQGKQE